MDIYLNDHFTTVRDGIRQLFSSLIRKIWYTNALSNHFHTLETERGSIDIHGRADSHISGLVDTNNSSYSIPDEGIGIVKT